MNHKIKVLVVDDNKMFRNLLVKDLEEDDAFHVVGIAEDGRGVSDLVEKLAPDLLLLDIIMPFMDGICVMKQLRARGLLDRTKVMIVSAVTLDSMISRVLQVGAEYFLAKPCSNEYIISMAKDIIMGEKEDLSVFPTLPSPDTRDLVEQKITTLIRQMGIPAHIKGYQYLRFAIREVFYDSNNLTGITKQLYPKIARSFNTAANRVERAIRHAIDVAWSRGDADILHDIFSFNVKSNRGRPTNSEFIAMVADKLRMEDCTLLTP